jgi:hypothetical protein
VIRSYAEAVVAGQNLWQPECDWATTIRLAPNAVEPTWIICPLRIAKINRSR